MHSTLRPRLTAAFSIKALACTTLLAAVGSLVISFVMSSQPAQAQALPPMSIQFNPETLRSPGRPGGRRRGGGSRGECTVGDVPLSAIAYSETKSSQSLGVDIVSESVGSFTTQAQPLLWFYMPRAMSGETGAELIVKNERDELVYRGRLSGSTDGSGIINVPMPIAMEPASAYHWFLALDCGESSSESVDGWVVRQAVDPNSARLLTQAAALNRVALYTNYGYVQDALSELAMLRLADLDNREIAADWVGFLSGLGLEDLTAAPILDCCKLTEIGAEEPEVKAVEEIMPIEAEKREVPRQSVIEQVRDRGRSPRDQ